MGPAIGRSIGAGFRAANRSWAGLGLLVASWAAVWAVSALLMLLTKMPAELLRPPQPGAAVTAPQPVAPASEPEAAAENTQDRADREAVERWTRTAGEWLGRAWPVMLLVLALLLAANTWLAGGQIGYLSKIVQDGNARLAEFWQAGTRAFPALLGAWLLTAGVALAGVLVVVLLSLIANAVPAVVSGVLGLLMALGAAVALVWLAVRLVFWYPAIVIAGAGPVAGLKASFQATRGRWWSLCGLIALLGVIFFGISMLLGVIEGLANTAGGGAGRGLGIAINLLGAAVNFYLGFVSLAAVLRFYADVTSSAPAPSAQTASPAAG
ncbi:MAG: hypothetical protein HY353_02685 [Candidatus Omnitrophica bacterium]|nr:hypothetical protein [Candidatus Omnitrophota bacterium]